MNIKRDSESLEQKMIRLSNAHNNLTMQVGQNAGQTQLFIDSLMKVLENEVEDFREKYTKARFEVNLENLVQARLNAHLVGDLNSYAGFGEQLKAMRKEAKENGKLSLYNKAMRRMEKMIQEEDFGDRGEDIDPKRIVGTPDLEVIDCDKSEV